MKQQSAQTIVILTGAGISAELGLPTFRGAGGLWEGQRVEEVATPDAFQRNPGLVHRFYNARRARLRDPEIVPNPAHLALAELDRRWAGEFLLVTQNVDNLHERAGSRRLLHLHGELMRALCTACGESAAWEGDMGEEFGLPSVRRHGQPAARHRLVRRDALPDGRGLRRAGAMRPVRRHRHLGAGLPGCRLRRGGTVGCSADDRAQFGTVGDEPRLRRAPARVRGPARSGPGGGDSWRDRRSRGSRAHSAPPGLENHQSAWGRGSGRFCSRARCWSKRGSPPGWSSWRRGGPIWWRGSRAATPMRRPSALPGISTWCPWARPRGGSTRSPARWRVTGSMAGAPRT